MIALQDRPLGRVAWVPPIARLNVHHRAASPRDRVIVAKRGKVIVIGGDGLWKFQPNDIARRQILGLTGDGYGAPDERAHCFSKHFT